MADGLYVLFNFPKDGFAKARDPRLDPPVRVTGVFKESFGLTPSCPARWPEKPPQDWERFFLVDLAVKDAAGVLCDKCAMRRAPQQPCRCNYAVISALLRSLAPNCYLEW